MVAYLFELGYDLMLAPVDTISKSPGFETQLRIFGGQDSQTALLLIAELIVLRTTSLVIISLRARTRTLSLDEAGRTHVRMH